MRKRVLVKDNGIALIMVLGVLAVLLVLAVTFAFNTRLHQRAARNYLDYLAADFFAKSGLEHAIATVREPLSGYVGDEFAQGRTVTYHDPGEFFEYTITPESGSLNLNFTGNLSDGGSFHDHNEGWTTFEISIAKVLAELLNIPLSQAEEMARDIIEYRYGGEATAGDPFPNDTYDANLATDGIDHDADGEPDVETDPFWFSWLTNDPRSGHLPFTSGNLSGELESLDWVATDWEAIDSSYTNWDTWNEIWDEIKDHVTIGTRSSDELTLHPVNLNAVESAQVLFDEMGLSEGTFAQKAVNIIDYRDANHAISSLVLAQTYYGVESILINEVLANSYDVRDTDSVDGEPLVNAEPNIMPKEFRFDGLAPNTAYRLRIHAGDIAAGSFEVRVGNDSGFDPTWRTLSQNSYIDYPLSNYCISSYEDGGGYLLIESRPIAAQVHEDAPPDWPEENNSPSVPSSDGFEYSASAYGEYSEIIGEEVITYEAYMAFDKNFNTWWRVQGNLEDIDLPPAPLTANTTVIEDITYVVSASAYNQNQEPWRAFGTGYWEATDSPLISYLPPTMSSSSLTVEGITYRAAASDYKGDNYPWKAFDGSSVSYWGVDFDTITAALSIYDWEELAGMKLDRNYILMNDLDEETEGYEEYASATANGGAGWIPIGTSGGGNAFTGTFNGNNYSIRDLVINRPGENYVGVFGMVSFNAEIKNLRVEDVSIIGNDDVGGVVGANGGSISNVSSSGSVVGNNYVGGLIGTSIGDINISYSLADVTGNERVGGLVGTHDGFIANSYARGSVEGARYAGGLCGTQNGVVENTYSTGFVNCSHADSGGLIGGGNATVSFYDTETSGMSDTGKGEPKSTAEMKDEATFTVAGWDFVETWAIDDTEGINAGYPYLVAGETFSVSGAWIEIDLGKREAIYALRLDQKLGYGISRFNIRARNPGEVWQTVLSGASARNIEGWQGYTFDRSNYRYWRLYPTEAYDETTIQISRISLETREYESWIALDIGEERTIHEVKITNASTGYGVENFTIQGSHNGSSWIDVFEGKAQDTTAQQTGSIDPTAYRHWRLFVDSMYNDNGVIRIRDIKYVTKELENPVWIALTRNASDTRPIHAVEIQNYTNRGVSDFRVRASNSPPPGQGVQLPGSWITVYTGTAENNDNVQKFDFGEEDYRYWALEVLSIYDEAGGDILVREVNYRAGPAIRIEKVEFVGPEFIELVNIGGASVDLEDWVIETPYSINNIRDGVARERDAGNHLQWNPSNYVIEPGEYFVIAGDMALFARSFGDGAYEVFPEDSVVVDMNGNWLWGAGAFDHVDGDNINLGGELGIYGDGIYLYDDRGRLADLVVHGANNNIANVSWAGNSQKIGISREKNDPAVRQFWRDKLVSDTDDTERGASPARHNTRLSEEGEDIIDDIYNDEPPLVKNNPFANVGEVVNITSLGYPGVRSGRQWTPISTGRLSSIARRCSTYYIRLDAEKADNIIGDWSDIPAPEPYNTAMYEASSSGDIGSWEWDNIRLNPDIEYDLYIYGIYSNGTGVDLELTIGADTFEVEYKEADGAHVARIDDSHIGADGSLEITLESTKDNVYFDYILLIPDGVPGKLNISAASKEVLMGLPGVDSALASAIYAGRPYSNISRLLQVLSAEQYAPIANLVASSVIGSSAIYRIICTGRHIGPGGPAVDPTATRRIEMIVEVSNGNISIMSWKYLY